MVYIVSKVQGSISNNFAKITNTFSKINQLIIFTAQ